MKKVILIFSLIFIILTNTLIVSAASSDKQTITITTEIPYNYAITFINNGNGSIIANNISIKGTYSTKSDRHSDLLITFKPDNGYKLSKVILNDKDITSLVNSNTYMIKDITMDYTVIVTFEKKSIQEEVEDIPSHIKSSTSSIINKTINGTIDYFKDNDSIYNFTIPNANIYSSIDEDSTTNADFVKTGDTLLNSCILISLCILSIVIFTKTKNK